MQHENVVLNLSKRQLSHKVCRTYIFGTNANIIHLFLELFKRLSMLDRLLTPLIILAMIIGVVIGEFVPHVQQAFDTVRFDSVSVRTYTFTVTFIIPCLTLSLELAIAIGLIVMMWPILTKIRYESLPALFSSPRIWIQIGISLFLNWIVGPLVMVGLAWATLPDLPTYRTGVIMVGLARCIAMVVIWNQLARGNGEYCAILVVINSVLQIILYSPYALLFINTIGGKSHVDIHVSYKQVAISVLIVSCFFPVHQPASNNANQF
jgi:arsenite transporter